MREYSRVCPLGVPLLVQVWVRRDDEGGVDVAVGVEHVLGDDLAKVPRAKGALDRAAQVDLPRHQERAEKLRKENLSGNLKAFGK